MNKIQTERLLLREWDNRDFNDLWKLGSCQSVEKAGWKKFNTPEESRQFIKDATESKDSWAIVQKSSNTVIGWIMLGDTGRYEGYKEIEYIISDEFSNHGYATESVKVVLQYAFEILNICVVAVCHYPDNLPSKRVIEKCGFTYEGTLRKYSRNMLDSVRYSMLKEEWEKKNG